MTRKQIDKLSFAEALTIFKMNGQKIDFDTQKETVKTFARNFLRKNKNYRSCNQQSIK